jgi:hypothetical protein
MRCVRSLLPIEAGLNFTTLVDIDLMVYTNSLGFSCCF